MATTVFYGAGQNAKDNTIHWIINGLKPVCFADIDPMKHYTKFNLYNDEAVEILPLKEVISRYPDYELYLTQVNTLPVRQYLIEIGIPAERLNNCYDSFYPNIYTDLYRIYCSLQDDMSRAFFLGRIERSLTQSLAGIYRAMMRSDYMEWALKKEIKEINKIGKTKLSNNILHLLKSNYPTQKNDIYLVYFQCEARWHKANIWYLENFLSAISDIGIIITGCCKPGSSDVEFMGIPCINENDLKSMLNSTSKIIVSLPSYSIYYKDVVEMFSEYTELLFPFTRFLLPQYFEADLFIPNENEVFVDIGVFDFADSKNFCKWAAKGYERIYAFEPDPAGYQKSLETLSSLSEISSEKVELVNKGLSDKSGYEEFPAIYGNGENENKINVEVVRLDEYLCGKPVTFIKMDVDGAEMKVLKGALNTIKRHRPRLAVCIYHKYQDIYEIMSYILSLVPEYKCYIRHYSSLEIETVLLCTI